MKAESFRKRKGRGEVDSVIRALGSLEMKRMGKNKINLAVLRVF